MQSQIAEFKFSQKQLHICPLRKSYGTSVFLFLYKDYLESLAASSTSGQSRYTLAKSAECRPVAVCRLNVGYRKLLFAPFRNYTVVNPEKGVIEVERMSCPGMKLCCQLKFQNALWAATEVNVVCTSVPHSRGASLEETKMKRKSLLN